MSNVVKTTYDVDGKDLTIELNEGNHRYKINGESGYASVTGILGMLDKPALTKYLQKVGFLAAAKYTVFEGFDLLGVAQSRDVEIDDVEWEPIFDALKTHRWRSWDIMEKRGEEGTLLHDVAEGFGNTGQIRSLETLPEEVRPRVQGFAKFLRDATPQFASTEVLVASLEHRYAGKYDARMMIPSCDLVVDAETGERQHFPMGMYLVDYKTGKFTYDEASLQLAAYEGASVECGHTETDGQFVVRLTKDGGYEAVRSWSKPETFHALAAAHAALKQDKTDKSDASKAAAKAAAEGVAA